MYIHMYIILSNDASVVQWLRTCLATYVWTALWPLYRRSRPGLHAEFA